jgi:hypothetical protein
MLNAGRKLFRLLGPVALLAGMAVTSGCSREAEDLPTTTRDKAEALAWPTGRFSMTDAGNGAVYVLDTRYGVLRACQKAAAALTVACGQGEATH